MKVVERILFSSGCCGDAAQLNVSELWLALILGLIISSLFLGCCKIWRKLAGRRDTDIQETGQPSMYEDSEEDVSYEAGSVSHLQYMNVPRVHEAVTEYLQPSRTSSHELHHRNHMIIRDLPSYSFWTKYHLQDHPSYSEDVKRLECNVDTILQEFRVVNNSFLNNQTDGWKVDIEHKLRVFHLMRKGKVIKSNCDRCPQTKQFIHHLSNIMDSCTFGYMSFSVMEPKSSIATHRGVTNIRIRCHLGLMVPSSGSYLTVNSEKQSWENGKCLVFEDFQPHHSENLGNSIRAVFIVDLWHPNLHDDEIDYFKSYFCSSN